MHSQMGWNMGTFQNLPIKAAEVNSYKNNFLLYLLKLSPLAPPIAPNVICKNPPQPNRNNQSEPGRVSDEVSINAQAHAVGSPPLTRSSQAQFLR